jgi:predicted DNA-binding protein (UPF0251 family)
MIEPSMKRDDRKFDHQTLEAVRIMAVEQVREGEHPADVIASYGFNRTTLYRRLDAATQAVAACLSAGSRGDREVAARALSCDRAAGERTEGGDFLLG